MYVLRNGQGVRRGKLELLVELCHRISVSGGGILPRSVKKGALILSIRSDCRSSVAGGPVSC